MVWRVDYGFRHVRSALQRAPNGARLSSSTAGREWSMFVTPSSPAA